MAIQGILIAGSFTSKNKQKQMAAKGINIHIPTFL
jgi:hypothetical protein